MPDPVIHVVTSLTILVLAAASILQTFLIRRLSRRVEAIETSILLVAAYRRRDSV